MTQSLTLPGHVGIIMDGNGRWATARGLSRNRGHKRGAEVFGEIVRHAKKLGIPYRKTGTAPLRKLRAL